MVNCTGEQYDNVPQPGSVLKVAYSGRYKSGKLRYPWYISVRSDLTWEQVKQKQ